MNELFEKQRNAMVDDYEAKLRALEERMKGEYERMRSGMQAKIDDLLEQLR